MAHGARVSHQSRRNACRARPAPHHGAHDRRRRADGEHPRPFSLGRGHARLRRRRARREYRCKPHGVQSRARYDTASARRPVRKDAPPLRTADRRGNRSLSRLPSLLGYLQRPQHDRHDAAARRARPHPAHRRRHAHLSCGLYARAHPARRSARAYRHRHPRRQTRHHALRQLTAFGGRHGAEGSRRLHGHARHQGTLPHRI